MQATNQDLINQSNMANFLINRGWLVEEIGNPYYPADYLASKDGFQALIEYKRRFFPVNQYPSFQLFARKFSQLRCMAREWGVQPVLVSEWDDCIGYVNLFHVEPVICMGGRTDRGKNEAEPVVDISLAYFRQIK